VLKKTWGESIVRSLGFGLVQFLFLFVGILAFGSAIAGVVSMGAGSSAILAVVVLGVVYVVGVSFVFMLAHMIFNTALYAYASEGAMAPGYDDEMLRTAFHTK
jgi:hypothetical protein